MADIIAETAAGAKPHMADFRVIPSIEQLRQRAGVRALEARYGRTAVVNALRAEAETLRARLDAGDAGGETAKADAAAAIEQGLAARLADELAPSLTTVINATGVIIHTNLGRAPLAGRPAASVAAIASAYANLEYDLDSGRRGARDSHAEHLIQRLTGAEAAIVVNNNAAAALLTLAALARGREVIVSRGELVEIGGGFRVPDVMAQSGATLREVGTTNRTRASDYAAAISERTALILRVHPSNFRIEGFTERPSLEDLAGIARRFAIPLAEDLGSGYLGVAAGAPAIAGEPEVRASLEAGADVVFFSGDKLLGGPQAGIVAGRRDLVGVIRRHPLMRALRVDKLTYAALEATLVEYATGRAAETVPVLRMVTATREEIEARATALAPILSAAGFTTALLEGYSTIGGGSAPGSQLPTVLVALSRPGVSADALEARLRMLDPPIVGRIEDDQVVLDLRTVLTEQDGILATALSSLTHRRDP